MWRRILAAFERHRVFANVEEAGGLLAEGVAGLGLSDAVVLAVGDDGLPMARSIAARLGVEKGRLGVAHLCLPWRTTLAFGALTDDDHHFVDPVVATDHSLGAREIAQIARDLLPVLREGTPASRAERRPLLTGRVAVLACGWLSTGYRALAVAAAARAAGASDVVVASPCAARDAFVRVEASPAKMVVLDVYDGPRFDPGEWFAVMDTNTVTVRVTP